MKKDDREYDFSNLKTIIISIIIVFALALAARFGLNAIDPSLINPEERVMEEEMTDEERELAINLIFKALNMWMESQNGEGIVNE